MRHRTPIFSRCAPCVNASALILLWQGFIRLSRPAGEASGIHHPTETRFATGEPDESAAPENSNTFPGSYSLLNRKSLRRRRGIVRIQPMLTFPDVGYPVVIRIGRRRLGTKLGPATHGRLGIDDPFPATAIGFAVLRGSGADFLNNPPVNRIAGQGTACVGKE